MSEIQRDLKHNWIANLLDGAFFGFALGFASFITILPLFVSTMTESAILIGLVPTIHNVGWQLPQLFLANRVARQRQYRSMTIWMSIHERLPILGLAAVAWWGKAMGVQTALLITFILLIWQGLGSGFTANPWQSMIAKIIPAEQRGTFLGAQSASANLLASVGAVLAGMVLSSMTSPTDFAICFLAASFFMLISWFFLAWTREQDSPPPPAGPEQRGVRFWSGILQRDVNFRWFLVVRMVSQLSVMGFAFYTVYAVRQLGLNEIGVGLVTGIYTGVQIIINPIMGWMGDRWSRRNVLELGILAAIGSALCAWWAPSANWFYLVFLLAGIANVSIWTVSLAMVLEFGEENERPAYIGLANTLVAPMTILTPFIGGWMADSFGYPAAFIASALAGAGTELVIHLKVRDQGIHHNENND